MCSMDAYEEAAKAVLDKVCELMSQNEAVPMPSIAAILREKLGGEIVRVFAKPRISALAAIRTGHVYVGKSQPTGWDVERVFELREVKP